MKLNKNESPQTNSVIGAKQNQHSKYRAILSEMQDGTHVKNIFGHLVKYGRITSMEAFQLYGNTRISSTIACIRDNYDVEIITSMVHGKNRFGHKTKYGEFILWEEENDTVES